MPLASPHAGAQTAETAIELNNRAVDLANHAQFEPALKLINQALALNPRNEHFIGNKISILQDLNRNQEALDLVDKALHTRPYSVDLRSTRSDILNRLDLRTEAYHQQLELYCDGSIDAPTELLEEDYLGSGITKAALTPRAGEFRLDGFFVNASENALVFDAFIFAVPSGKFRLIGPKRKVAHLRGLQPEYVSLGSIPVSQLRRGDFITMVGCQMGNDFVPRRLIVASRTSAEEKRRGSLFDGAAIPDVEDEDYPELNDQADGETKYILKDGTVLGAQSAAFLRNGDCTALVTAPAAFDEAEYQGLPLISEVERSAKLAKKLADLQTIIGPDRRAKPVEVQASLPLHFKVGTPFAGGEIIATAVKNAPAALPLASQCPKRGDTVFLQEWYGGDAVINEAAVVLADSTRLFLRVGTGQECYRAPGSVIVNGGGEVVGLSVATGTGIHGDGPYVSGVSLPVLRQAIAAVSENKPTKH